MHDIWNPWHGCNKKSEGCANCYMYYLDKQRNQEGSNIFRVKNNFNYPIQKDRQGNYKIKSGEFLRVCMTSDFFLEEADKWREETWNIMKIRQDVIFILITKRPERVEKCLPKWDNFNNIWFHVTCENQKRTNERVPILIELPFKHKGVMVAPFIEEISLKKYLLKGKIENVWCGGENYDGCRPLYYEWVKKLSEECKENDVSFKFFETGNFFVKDGKRLIVKNKLQQMEFAYKFNLNYKSSKPQIFDVPKYEENFEDTLFGKIDVTKRYKKHCKYCCQKEYCIGCSECGKCDKFIN